MTNVYTCWCLNYFCVSDSCENPGSYIGDFVMIHVNGEEIITGSNVTFTCPPGRILTGPDASTCMGNGEWHPNPRNSSCTGENKQKISLYLP